LGVVVSRDEFQNSAGDVGRLQLQLIGDVVGEFDHDLHGVILFRDGNLSRLPMMGVPLILNLTVSIKQRRDR
jgi:hypothetical protein